jgi:hypothetical protein
MSSSSHNRYYILIIFVYFLYHHRIILLENSRSKIPFIGWFQDLTEPFVTPLSKGCKWNVDISKLVGSLPDKLQLVHEESESLGTVSLRVYTPSRADKNQLE